MKIIVDESKIDEIKNSSSLLEEILNDDSSSEDRGIVQIGQNRSGGKKDNRSDLEREMIAVDALTSTLSQKTLARIHNTSQSDISDLKNGERSDGKKLDSVSVVVESIKNTFVNTAEKKLLESLNFFEPMALEQKQLPGAMKQLADVIESVKGKKRDEINGVGNVHLHFYSPKQKHVSDYETIDV